MKKIIIYSVIFLTFFLLQSTKLFCQSMGINGSGSTPNISALLDIDAAGMSPRGLLIPRIALTSATDAATIVTPATSLLVYNTGAGALIPAGYYYNQGNPGSPNWVPFLTNNVNAPAAWSITGNTGTTGGPNFIGPTDNISLRFRTNNTQKMIIDSLGNVGIGTTLPSTKLQVSGGSAGSTTILQIISSLRSYASNPDGAILGFTASNGTLGTHDFGALFAGNNTDWAHGGSGVVELRVGGNSTATGSSAAAFIQGKSMGFLTEALSVALRTNNTDRLFIDYGGYVGIGTSVLLQKLHVVSGTSGENYPLELEVNGTAQVSQSTGLRFRVEGSASDIWAKGGIAFQSTGTYGRGSLFFLQNNVADNSNAAISNAVMAITAAGNVGIGTTVPGSILQVRTFPADLGSFPATTTGVFFKSQNNNGGSTPAAAEPVLTFAREGIASQAYANFADFKISRWTNVGTEARTELDLGLTHGNGDASTTNVMTWRSDGNVGIGTTAPGYKLTVNGQPAANGYVFFTNYSDARLKKNITTIGNCLEKIMLLRPVQFNYNEEYLNLYNDTSALARVQKGFIAQEVKDVFPEMVGTTKVKDKEYYDLNLSNLQVYMVKTMQEQQKRIKELKKEIAVLKKRN